MRTSPIAFNFTSDMHAWIHTTQIDGPCSVFDKWTYGHVLITPTLRTYTESGVPKTFIAKDWQTVNLRS